jgi:hypothetical protein
MDEEPSGLERSVPIGASLRNCGVDASGHIMVDIHNVW